MSGIKKSSLFGGLAKIGAALGAAVLLTLGAALPAQAVTNVTSGHVDVVAVNSSNIGSKIGSTFYRWSGGTPLFDHQFVYNNALSVSGVTCSAGVLSIPESVSSSSLPSLGLDNWSMSSYKISVSKVAGSLGTGGVTLNTALAGTVSTTGGTETIGPLGHEHGDWTFAVGDCSSGKQHTFTLGFTAEKVGTPANTGSRNIDFIINM
ncbi:MAG: hypothetical protein ACK5LO_13560 [Leucobacter sp.]